MREPHAFLRILDPKLIDRDKMHEVFIKIPEALLRFEHEIEAIAFLMLQERLVHAWENVFRPGPQRHAFLSRLIDDMVPEIPDRDEYGERSPFSIFLVILS